MHMENHVPHETMVEIMVGSTSNANNVHGVVNDNINLYRNMVMDTMRMNRCHIGQCSTINDLIGLCTE